jgi:hypothetical protein
MPPGTNPQTRSMGGRGNYNTPNLEADIRRLAKRHPGIKALGGVATTHAGSSGTHIIQGAWNPTYTEIGKRNADPRVATMNALQAQFEAEQAAKWQFNKWLSPTLQAYAAMNIYLREYRRNFLVRGSINALAFWTTKEGFDTEVEVPDQEGLTDEQIDQYRKKFNDVKNFVDTINKKVRLKAKLRTAQIKKKIYGRAGFEIEYGLDGKPSRLLALDSQIFIGTEPLIDSNWILRGFSYKGMGTSFTQPFYKPEECLYFTNNELEDDYQGLSDVEPILKESQLDDKIVREDLTEAATTMWAGVIVWLLDRSKLPNMSDGYVQGVMDSLTTAIMPGKHIATEAVWQPIPVKLQVDLNQLLAVQDSCERRIVGNFGVPRFMLNIEKELNRATAYAELEAFVDGPVTDAQEDLAYQVEQRWYDLLIRIFYKLKPDMPHEKLPCHIRHKWHEIRTTDWFQLIASVSTAYQAGWVDQEKAYDMMYNGPKSDFDPDELRDETTGEFQQKLPPHTMQPKGFGGGQPGLGPTMPPALAGSIKTTALSQVRGLRDQLRIILDRARSKEITKPDALTQGAKIVESYDEAILETSKRELQAQTGIALEKLPPEVYGRIRDFRNETMRAFQLVLNDISD